MEMLLTRSRSYQVSNRLIEVATDTHPPEPNTLQRLRMVLLRAVGISQTNTRFAALITGSLGVDADILAGLKSKVGDLTALLQDARRLASAATTRRRRRRRDSSSAAAAHLAGLHGDDLFRALMALHLPPDTTAPEVYLEAALAAQRLIMHDHLHKYVQLYERILFKANTTVAYEDDVRFFVDHVQTLEKFIRDHVNLAAAAVAASRGSTGPPK